MTTLEEALAACKAQNLGPSACAELVEPFCDGRGVIIEAGQMPRCKPAPSVPSPAKVAILQREAAERAAAATKTPWLLFGLAAGACGLAYLALRSR